MAAFLYQGGHSMWRLGCWTIASSVTSAFETENLGFLWVLRKSRPECKLQIRSLKTVFGVSLFRWEDHAFCFILWWHSSCCVCMVRVSRAYGSRFYALINCLYRWRGGGDADTYPKWNYCEGRLINNEFHRHNRSLWLWPQNSMQRYSIYYGVSLHYYLIPNEASHLCWLPNLSLAPKVN